MHAAEQDRPDIRKRREAWFEGQLDLDPERLVFIDETWASTDMTRRYGRAARGRRLRVGVPHGRWKTTTVVAGLRRSGLVAPFVLDGPINRAAFEAYVEKVLVPARRPGDVVRKNRNWTAARTDVGRPGESFYKDGAASCGPTPAGSDEEARLSHNAKRGRSRSCASWLSCPGRRTALWVHCYAAGQ